MVDTKSFIKEMFYVIFYWSFWNPVYILEHISVRTRYILSPQQVNVAFCEASGVLGDPVCL